MRGLDDRERHRGSSFWRRRRVLLSALTVCGVALLSGLRCGRSAGPDGPDGSTLSKVVIGYYPSWRRDSFPPSRILFGSVTHIAHAFAWPDTDGNLVVPVGIVHPELNAAAHTAGVKMIISLGGWGNSDGFAGMSATSANRSRFIGQVLDFCRAHDYDGVDIDWEFVDTPTEQTGFELFIRELSTALKSGSPPLLLTMAAPAGDYYGRWIDFPGLISEFDFIGFMTYDFHGSWSDHAGHNSPLYPDNGDSCGSVSETYDYARSRGVPAAKLLLGVPFYGRGFDCGAVGQPFTLTQDYSYTDVMGLLDSGWQRAWDGTARVPTALRPDTGMILCYDDGESVGEKCDYVKARGGAGLIVWELTQDDRNGTSELLTVIGEKFRLPSGARGRAFIGQ